MSNILEQYATDNGELIAYAWPGGYPVFYLTADNGVLCPKCANDNRQLLDDPDDKQWYVVAADCNWEDPDVFCDNCNQRIESAYCD